jgi:hypothetical protein
MNYLSRDLTEVEHAQIVRPPVKTGVQLRLLPRLRRQALQSGRQLCFRSEGFPGFLVQEERTRILLYRVSFIIIASKCSSLLIFVVCVIKL